MELDLLLPGQFRVVPAEVSEKGMKLRRRRPDISAETSRLNSVFNCAPQLNLLRSGFGEFDDCQGGPMWDWSKVFFYRY